METGAADVGALFEALADPTRRQVVRLLGGHPHRAGELAQATGTTGPTMSRHLRVLLDAGIVADERVQHDARVRLFRLRPQSVVALRVWVDQLPAEWDHQLGSFKDHVERDHDAPTPQEDTP